MENDLVRCNRCGKSMITEEYDQHLCTPITRGYKTIEIDYFGVTKDRFGRQTVIAKGLDGILYTLVKREKKESDRVPFCPPLLPSSDESLQSKKKDRSDGDLTAPRR